MELYGDCCSCRVSSGIVAQKNRKLRIEKIVKIGNFVFKNRRQIGKSIVVSSTKIAGLPAPHRGYNKGYEFSASMFAGFRSTFAA